MTQLRWVLLALGGLVILAIYLWGRGIPARWLERARKLRAPRTDAGSRVEPSFSDAAEGDLPGGVAHDHEIVAASGHEEPEPGAQPDVPSEPPQPIETVITLRFIPHDKELPSDRVILALRAAGLKHGRFGIFHMHADQRSDEPLFSVANLTEPGSFDLTRLTETTIKGMSFFMVLPGEGDPVERFDRMVATARELARELDAELRDDRGSSWSIQRERYVREEVIEYRHSLERHSTG